MAPSVDEERACQDLYALGHGGTVLLTSLYGLSTLPFASKSRFARQASELNKAAHLGLGFALSSTVSRKKKVQCSGQHNAKHCKLATAESEEL